MVIGEGCILLLIISFSAHTPSHLQRRGKENTVGLQSYTSAPPVEERVYDDLESSNAYINAENYQYVNQLNRSRIDKGNSDGHYTALNPKTVEQHTYATATPLSHRSLSSLHNADTEYTEVEVGYLQVLPPTRPCSLPTNTEEDLYENDVRSRSATSPAELDPETGYDTVNHV